MSRLLPASPPISHARVPGRRSPRACLVHALGDCGSFYPFPSSLAFVTVTHSRAVCSPHQPIKKRDFLAYQIPKSPVLSVLTMHRLAAMVVHVRSLFKKNRRGAAVSAGPSTAGGRDDIGPGSARKPAQHGEAPEIDREAAEDDGEDPGKSKFLH